MRNIAVITLLNIVCCLSLYSAAQDSIRVTVRQNRAYYDAFDPIALEVEVKDAKGQPVCGAVCSVAVCDAEGDIVAVSAPTMLESLCPLPDSMRYEGLYPVEQHFRLPGRVYDDRGRPRRRAEVLLDMYTLDGDGRRGEVVTDNQGRFVIESEEPLYGTYYAQFTVRKDGKNKWSRVALDRNFAPPTRVLTEEEMTLVPPRNDSVRLPVMEIDTFDLKGQSGILLKEVRAKARRRYQGFKGNRYTYQGGERAGQRRADGYLDVTEELEKHKDMGEGDLTIWDLLRTSHLNVETTALLEDTIFEELIALNPPLEQYLTYDPILKRLVRSHSPLPDILPYRIYADGVDCLLFVNNRLVCFSDNAALSSESLVMCGDELAEGYKSALLMKNMDDWMRFVPAEMYAREESWFIRDGGRRYALFLYEQPEYHRVHSRRKGMEKRFIKAFDRPCRFKSPRYNGIDTPSENDLRRTLSWEPTLITGEDGKATLTLYNGANDHVRPRVSLRGVTQEGQPFGYETGVSETCPLRPVPEQRKGKPQERVYLHLDNTAYVEGDSLWFQAYVQDARLGRYDEEHSSRVLYVDLVNAEGYRIAHKILEVGDGGLCSGCMSLDLPIRRGYYELRAYTRSMLNWGDANYYSRIIPVVGRQKR